jgi:outer membrane lipoprotein-sorting protein
MIRRRRQSPRSAILTAIPLGVLALVARSPGAAAEDEPEAPIDPAAAWIAHAVGCLDKTRTLEADFTQEIIHRLDGRAEVARGKLQLRRGHRLRMEYDDPPGALLVSDGTTVRAWDPQTRTLYESPVRGTLITRVIAFVHHGSRGDDFRLRWLGGDRAPGPGKRGVIELRPADREELASRVVITLSGDCPPLLRLTIVDRAGTATRLTLANQQPGRVGPAGRFRLDPPSGAKIVKP